MQRNQPLVILKPLSSVPFQIWNPVLGRNIVINGKLFYVQDDTVYIYDMASGQRGAGHCIGRPINSIKTCGDYILVEAARSFHIFHMELRDIGVTERRAARDISNKYIACRDSEEKISVYQIGVGSQKNNNIVFNNAKILDFCFIPESDRLLVLAQDNDTHQFELSEMWYFERWRQVVSNHIELPRNQQSYKMMALSADKAVIVTSDGSFSSFVLINLRELTCCGTPWKVDFPSLEMLQCLNPRTLMHSDVKTRINLFDLQERQCQTILSGANNRLAMQGLGNQLLTLEHRSEVGYCLNRYAVESKLTCSAAKEINHVISSSGCCSIIAGYCGDDFPPFWEVVEFSRWKKFNSTLQSHVLSFLGFQETTRIQQVSKATRALAQRTELWKPHFYRHFVPRQIEVKKDNYCEAFKDHYVKMRQQAIPIRNGKNMIFNPKLCYWLDCFKENDFTWSVEGALRTMDCFDGHDCPFAYWAVKNGYQQGLDQLYAARSGLFTAIYCNQSIAVISGLINTKQYGDYKVAKNTPLHDAVIMRQLNLVKAVMPLEEKFPGRTDMAFFIRNAIRWGCYDIAAFLITQGKEKEFEECLEREWINAVACNDFEAIEFLIGKKVNLQCKMGDGKTAFEATTHPGIKRLLLCAELDLVLNSGVSPGQPVGNRGKLFVDVMQLALQFKNALQVGKEREFLKQWPIDKLPEELQGIWAKANSLAPGIFASLRRRFGS